MWRDEVLPRLLERGVGADRSTLTLRLTGIGESALVDLIGEPLLRSANPAVATYAGTDAVDVRISATSDTVTARTAGDLVAEVARELEPRLEPHVFARGRETWTDALSARLAGRRLATVEIGTAGQLMALLGGAPFLIFGELLGSESARAHAEEHLELYAERVREMTGVEIGLAVRARERDGDTSVSIAIAAADGTTRVTRTAFLADEDGRRRAAVTACAELWRRLGGPARRRNDG